MYSWAMLIVAAVGFGLTLSLIVIGLAASVAFKQGKPLIKSILEGYLRERTDSLEARITEVEAQVDTLPETWEDFAIEAKKIQDRTRWHIRRVKKELSERGFADEEIDTLDSTLRPSDGGGGNGSGLQNLQSAVEEGPTEPPDSIAPALRRKWGFNG